MRRSGVVGSLDRVPAAFSSDKRRGRLNVADALDDEDKEEQDRELDLLTKTEHQGVLDRIAVRAELLRRRLEASPWRSAELQAHYQRAIDNLNLASSLRRILVEYLGVRSAL